MENYQTLFGPILSRRLGISLGINLIPYKTCCLDCIYCECGATTNLTDIRQEFIPTETIIKELNHYLSSKPKLDYITFSGSGEPTLASNIGKIIDHIKTNFKTYKTAVITNGNLLDRPDVQKDLLNADLVIPSLDSAIEKSFSKINRPIQNITVQNLIKGIIEFKKKYTKELWLEIFIIPGMNDTPKELKALKRAALQINPNKIQINSLDRPGTLLEIEVPTIKNLKKIADFFKPISVEIVKR